MPDLLNCNFGLLLKYNCSQALTTREVNIGKSSKPHGIKTNFIWSIGGGSHVQSGMLFCPKVTIQELPALTVKDIVQILGLDLESDNSARFKETCLNNHLLSGPHLRNRLMGVLCKFKKILMPSLATQRRCFTSFLNVKTTGYQRFLQWPNGEERQNPKE